MPLAKGEPVEGADDLEVGSATVRHKTYERALLMDAYYGQVVKYNITPGTRTFHALVGLTDDSDTCSVTAKVLVDERTENKVTVENGDVAELTAQLGEGSRLAIAVTYSACHATAAVINPVLRP